MRARELKACYEEFKILLSLRDREITAAAQVREEIAAFNFAAQRGHEVPERDRVARGRLCAISNDLRAVAKRLTANTARRRELLAGSKWTALSAPRN